MMREAEAMLRQLGYEAPATSAGGLLLVTPCAKSRINLECTRIVISALLGAWAGPSGRVGMGAVR
eukprot:1573900-Prymnesium_polylepis.1